MRVPPQADPLLYVSIPAHQIPSRFQLMRRVFLLSLATAALVWCVLTPAAKVSSQPAAAATRSLQVNGLRSPVTVRRDERSIPYIEAANDEDLYFAQGYV